MGIMIAITLSIVLGYLSASGALAGETSPAASNPKPETELKGMVFFNNRDEIVAKAKKEGKLRLLVNMDVPTLKAATKVFT